MNADVISFLKELGLSSKETELYLISLKSGPQSASTLAKKTNFPRSTIHFLMEELMRKGFVTKENREKTTYYEVIPIESLEYVLLQKSMEVKKQMEDLKKLTPLLEGLRSQTSLMPKMTYYFGLDGLYRTIDDCCTRDETVLFISSHANMHPKIRQYVEKIYIPKSKKHLCKNKMIISDTEATRAYLKKAEGVYDEVHFIHPEQFPLKLTLAIHGNKVNFISYDPEDLSGFIIENEWVADHMRTLFRLISQNPLAKSY